MRLKHNCAIPLRIKLITSFLPSEEPFREIKSLFYLCQPLLRIHKKSLSIFEPLLSLFQRLSQFSCPAPRRARYAACNRLRNRPADNKNCNERENVHEVLPMSVDMPRYCLSPVNQCTLRVMASCGGTDGVHFSSCRARSEVYGFSAAKNRAAATPILGYLLGLSKRCT